VRVVSIFGAIRRFIRDCATELRFDVDLDRAQLVADGALPQEVAHTGTLELVVADFLDVIGGRRP
jgi:hypothetical protein